jgi:hypothetical protein
LYTEYWKRGPPKGGDISRCHLGGKYGKGKEKQGNVKDKGRNAVQSIEVNKVKFIL